MYKRYLRQILAAEAGNSRLVTGYADAKRKLDAAGVLGIGAKLVVSGSIALRIDEYPEGNVLRLEHPTDVVSHDRRGVTVRVHDVTGTADYLVRWDAPGAEFEIVW